MKRFVLPGIVVLLVGSGLILYLLYSVGFFGVPEHLTQEALLKAEKQEVPPAVQKQIQQDLQQMRREVLGAENGSTLYPGAEKHAGEVSEQNPEREKQGEIENRYLNQLQSRIASYESRLYGLVYAAKEEYMAARQNGGSVKEIARKYISAGRTLENQCDAEVYAILTQFAQELSSNNLSTAVVERVKSAYETAKSERWAQLLKKINN
ncbi:hypothetical protein [Desulfurispora thermophila]|uniref:hypothetical protein n=1 Tax=Desulfurispora thermophila TaxID=265470 RepID=UPI00037AF699|nr:hypothetical protein [Desulfurispora thermophila]